MPSKVQDIKSVNILSGMKTRSVKEELAIDHPGHFQEYVFNVTNAPFHWELFELFLDGHNNPSGINGTVLDLAPRNHAKTTISEGFCCWKIGRNRSELVQFICSVMDLAEQRVGKIEDCIRNNKRFIEIFGDMYPHGDPDYTWNKQKLEVLTDKSKRWEEGTAERDATVTAFGITTSVEGGRATLQIYDDVVSLENVESELSRTRVSKKFWMSFDPMLVPDGQQIINGTRFHYADLYAELIQKFDVEGLYTDLYPALVVPE